MSRIGYFARTYGFDVLVVTLTVTSMLEVALRRDSADAPRTTLWFVVPAIAIMVLPLFARRRYPFGAPAAYWAIAAGLSFVDGRLIPFVASVYLIGMAVSFLLGNLRDALHARLGLAIVLGGAVIVVYNVPGHSTGQLVFIPLVFGICWLAGFALRGQAEQAEAAEARATQAERERESSARIAVAEERARIARELHDVVAHAVSVMVLQAGAVRHKLPDALTDEADALRGVEEKGRSALAEMRRLLGAMRHDGEGVELAPQPSLDGLDSLVAGVEHAGLPVRVQIEGEPFRLPPAIDLSAYRIVQEGLTNALKHARASHAEVIVCYSPEELRIEVRDDGLGGATSDGHGHGLVGIRERVKIYGGDMSVGTAIDGGFVLSTRLPLVDHGS